VSWRCSGEKCDRRCRASSTEHGEHGHSAFQVVASSIPVCVTAFAGPSGAARSHQSGRETPLNRTWPTTRAILRGHRTAPDWQPRARPGATPSRRTNAPAISGLPGGGRDRMLLPAGIWYCPARGPGETIALAPMCSYYLLLRQCPFAGEGNRGWPQSCWRHWVSHA
jgi:hypothetical protein